MKLEHFYLFYFPSPKTDGVIIENNTACIYYFSWRQSALSSAELRETLMSDIWFLNCHYINAEVMLSVALIRYTDNDQ